MKPTCDFWQGSGLVYTNRWEACDAMEEFHEADVAADVAEFLDQKEVGFLGFVVAAVDSQEDDLIVLETVNGSFLLKVIKDEE